MDLFMDLPSNPCRWVVARLFRFDDKINYYSMQVICNILAGSDLQFNKLMKMRPTWINDAIRFFCCLDPCRYPKLKSQECWVTLRIVYIVASDSKTFSKENIDTMKEKLFLPKVISFLQQDEKNVNPENLSEMFHWFGILQSLNIKEFNQSIRDFLNFAKPFQKQIDYFMGFDAFHECKLISLID